MDKTTKVKHTPLKRKTPMKRGTWKPKARTGLRQVSIRRRRELKEYSHRRKSFMALPENKWCKVAIYGVLLEAGLSDYIRSTDIHHMAGREGKLLNDERYWLAVSRKGHDWIHANPNKAREIGWLL